MQEYSEQELADALDWAENKLRVMNANTIKTSTDVRDFKVLAAAAADRFEAITHKSVQINKRYFKIPSNLQTVVDEAYVKDLAGIHPDDQVFSVIKDASGKSIIRLVDKHLKFQLKGGETFFTQAPLG